MSRKRAGKKPTTAPRTKEVDGASASSSRRAPRRCNALDGRRWLQNSISVWGDIRKSPEELRLKHPAMFPQMLAERLIESFLPAGPHVVLDPFAGTGSTLLAAERLGKRAVGLELSSEYVAIAMRRLAGNLFRDGSAFLDGIAEAGTFSHGIASRVSRVAELAEIGAEGAPKRGHLGSEAAGAATLYHASATRLLDYLPPASVDLCITSPPYWNILNQRRTADGKAVRHYGNLLDDLGTIADYDQFLDALAAVFSHVLTVLKPGAHCCVIVMDLRKKDRFYPFHSDLAARLQKIGFALDDLIVWNRQSEYNNLRPLGYPAVFRVNKVHEFVVLMQKPLR